MTLWAKGKNTEKRVMEFTVGNDPEYDKVLAPYDIVGSMAHAIMLGETGLISREAAADLVHALAGYFQKVKDNSFELNPSDEDIHSHLENYLVSKLGDTGKRIHTARSRNDQVLTAMQLLMKEEWRNTIQKVDSLFRVLLKKAEQHKGVLIPGYTHTQVAMPSSIALWLGAYAESLASDVLIAGGIVKVLDQNPLGSAAGYGSSFPVDREMTTKLAGFSEMLVSSVSAQLNRGKMETLMAYGLSSFAQTLSRFAADAILFMSQDFGFISFPESLTTGSSIMPHKKNPDVLELIRAHCNTVIQTPSLLTGMSANLISGYHRDFQLSKEILFPAIAKLNNCLEMTELMVGAMDVNSDVMDQEKYKYVYSVEEVNSKVMQGMSFRDAYKEVGKEINEGSYDPKGGHGYTHIGSIGNPGLEHIAAKMASARKGISIKAIDEIFKDLEAYYEK